MSPPPEITSVLVTGGCGFLGSRIVQHLQAAHPRCKITVIDKKITLPETDPKLSATPTTSAPSDNNTNPFSTSKSNPASAVNKTQPKEVEYIELDITSPQAVSSFFKSRLDSHNTQSQSFQCIIHTAGISPPLSERYFRRIHDQVFRINVRGTANLFESACNTGVECFVYTSSITAVTDDFSRQYAGIDERWPVVGVGRGTSYAESKVAAENIVLGQKFKGKGGGEKAGKRKFKTCALRPAPIFGEGDVSFIPNIVACLSRGEDVFVLGDGGNLWDTVYVGNVADAHVQALERLLSEGDGDVVGGLDGEAVFITNQEPVSCREFMLQCWKEYTLGQHVVKYELSIPLGLAWGLGWVCEGFTWLSGRSTTLSRGSVRDATATRYVNGKKAREVLGYEPRVGVEEGLRRTCAWLRENKIMEKMNGK